MNRNAFKGTCPWLTYTAPILLFGLLVSGYMRPAVGRSLDPNGRCTEVDWEEWYSSGLRSQGVRDVNTPNLLALVKSSQETVVKWDAILLLAERHVKDAIPLLEEALKDQSFTIRLAAASGLLKMGNRKGLEVLEGDCERCLVELDLGVREKASALLDASSVLADAGQLSAIRYLRKLLKYEGTFAIRLSALKNLAKLYDKDPTVLEDIVAMQKDPEGEVRAEAIEITRRLRPDHPSVSLEVLDRSISIRNTKKGQTHRKTVVIMDKHLDPNELGTLQIGSVVSIRGSKVKVIQTRPVRQGCEFQLEIHDPNRPVAVQVQSPDGSKVTGFDVDYLVIRFTDGRELTIPVQFYYDMGMLSSPSGSGNRR